VPTVVDLDSHHSYPAVLANKRSIVLVHVKRVIGKPTSCTVRRLLLADFVVLKSLFNRSNSGLPKLPPKFESVVTASDKGLADGRRQRSRWYGTSR
jgi:hypothetical protein